MLTTLLIVFLEVLQQGSASAAAIFVYQKGDIVKQLMKKDSFVPKNVPGVGWCGVGHVWVGWDGVGHVGVGWVIQGWGGSCRGGVGHSKANSRVNG